MPVIKDTVTDEGALVRVSIAWSASRVRKLRLAGRAVPVPLEAMALLDTGAEMTCIDPKLIAELDLPYDGLVIVNAPALQDVGFCPKHDASLTILHPSEYQQEHLAIKDLSVLSLPLGLLGYQVVIGRNVLSKCLFLYNGIGARFTLKY